MCKSNDRTCMPSAVYNAAFTKRGIILAVKITFSLNKNLTRNVGIFVNAKPIHV